jgi:parallel beta-helix repeat protein
VLSPRLLKALGLVLSLTAVIVLLLVVKAGQDVEAQTPPPAKGDWTISDTTSISSPVSLQGDLTIKSGGTLALDGSNVTFFCTKKGEYKLKVENGGTLIATNSAICAGNASLPFCFAMLPGSTADLKYCVIKGVGNFNVSMDTWGVYVGSASVLIQGCKITQCNVGLLINGIGINPTIEGNNISDNTDRAIWCKFSSPILKGNKMNNNGNGIYLENQSMPTILNNEFKDNRKEAIFMDTTSMANVSVNLQSTWVNATAMIRGNLTIEPGGTLSMMGSSVQLVSSSSDPRSVLVRSSGALQMLTGNSITTYAGIGNYAFIVEKGASFFMNGSRINRAGFDASGNLTFGGVYLAANAQISNSNLTGNYAALIVNGSVVNVSNTTLEGSWLDVWLGNSTVSLVNTSYRPTKIFFDDASSILDTAWHLNIGVLWQNGNGVADAMVSVKDGKGTELFNGLPATDGWVRWIKAIQSRTTKAGSTEYNPYSVIAKRTGMADLSKSVQVTANTDTDLGYTDLEPPVIIILTPDNNTGLNQTRLTVAGTASDNIGIFKVEAKLEENPRWTTLGNSNWNMTFADLNKGEHKVLVRATDVAGLTVTVSLTIYVDLESPQLQLDEPDDDNLYFNNNSVIFRGKTEAGANLTIDGQDYPINDDGSFSIPVNLSEGPHEVVIIIRDRGGNTIRLVRKLTVDTIPPPIKVTSPVNGLKTKLEEIQLVGTIEGNAVFRIDGMTVELGANGEFSRTIALSGGTKTLELYAADKAGNENTATFTVTREVTTSGGMNKGFFATYGTMLILLLVIIIVVVAVGGVAYSRSKKSKKPQKPKGPRITMDDEADPSQTKDGASIDEMLYGRTDTEPDEDESTKSDEDETSTRTKPAHEPDEPAEEDIPEATTTLVDDSKSEKRK